MAGDQGHDERVEAEDLAVEELGAATQLAQRDPGVVADDSAGSGPQGRQLGDQVSGGVRGEPGAQILGAGHDQGPGLVDRLGPLRAGTALGHHQHADRLHCAVASFRRAAGPAGLRGPGRADRIEGVRFAVAAAVLPVGAVDLDNPDASGGHVAGQAGAVAAGALDPDQAHRPELAQPAQQPGIPGRGDGELTDAEQPADRIQGSCDVGIGVGVYAAGNCACLYDGHCHLFSLVEEVARTRWPSDL